MNGVLTQVKSKLTAKDLLTGHFGIERESLRINLDGSLALSEHPSAFGEKLSNPYITTDFSESQVEMITPTFTTLEETYDFLNVLYDLVVSEIGDELLWPQSMPCPIEANQEIPIAMFGEGEAGERATNYRQALLQKYGGKRQLISGLHYNFSFSESLLNCLYQESKTDQSFQLFKDSIYLKIVRNYIRYRWFIIYLLGASPIVDESYCTECQLSSSEVAPKSYSHSGAISFRNSLCGYQNKKPIYVDYTNTKVYVESLSQYIARDEIESFKEFYSPIRLKAKNPDRLLDSLLEEGIEYLEIRSIDLNPFAKCGVTQDDLNFIHLFVLFLLEQEEISFEEWQQEAMENETRVAVSGLDDDVVLKNNGHPIRLEDWGQKILDEMSRLNVVFELGKESLIEAKRQEILNSDLTLSTRLVKQVEASNYLQAHLELANLHKQQSLNNSYSMPGYEDLELSTQLLIKESLKHGIKVEVLDRSENFIKLTKGERTEYVKQATKTSLDRYSSVLAMENKLITKKILSEHEIRVPEGRSYQTLKEAQKDFGFYQGQSIVIKPKSTNFGQGITILENLTNEMLFNQAIRLAFSMDNGIIIEEFVNGPEYRFLVIGQQVVGVLRRIPANVIGDGRQTIQALIEEKNKSLIRGENYRRPLEKIKVDEVVLSYLMEQGYELGTILPDGKQIFLRENSNISTGGDSLDMTDQVIDYYKDIAIQAANVMGTNICGVDMIIEDTHDATKDYVILELNFNPALHIHAFPFKGTQRQVALPILKELNLV